MKKTSSPYIIALDMDGTLLNSKKKISFKTACYLRKLTRQGHKVVIASGRPRRSIESYYDKLNLNAPVIGYNGEYIYSPKDNIFKTVRHSLDKDMCIEVIEKMGNNVLNFMCETDNKIWVDKEDKYLGHFFWYDNMEVHKGKIGEILNENVMTLLIHVPEKYKELGEIEKITSKWSDVIPVFWIGKPYLELHHNYTSKGAALKEIAEYYKIPSDRVIAFGDATNDIEMFEYAKTSVMMSNARYDLKDKVTMISVKDNDHNGIYYTLKKIFKENNAK